MLCLRRHHVAPAPHPLPMYMKLISKYYKPPTKGKLSQFYTIECCHIVVFVNEIKTVNNTLHSNAFTMIQ